MLNVAKHPSIQGITPTLLLIQVKSDGLLEIALVKKFPFTHSAVLRTECLPKIGS